MLINTDFIPPAELTGYARAALADLEVNQFTLSEFLPSVAVDDLVYRFTRGGRGLAEAATYRSYDAEASIGKRPGAARVQGELPPVSRKIRLSEYDRLRQRHADGPVADAIYSDTDLMVEAVAARIELARGSALSAGTVTINEDGVIATVDFGRRAGHTNVAPGTLWSVAASATPIADMIAWRKTYRANNGGRNPGAFLTSETVVSNILRAQEVRNLAAANGTVPSIISPLLLNSILATYSLPPIVVNDAQINVEGIATRVIPENNFLMLPAVGDRNLGGTFWGTTAESLEPDYGIEGDEAGIVAGAYSTKDPVALWTKAAGIALPVLANPDLSFQAVVLA
ncbi:major capsid protein [Herbiconiux sp. KACC 21604]|uniref:major capsid protein n=1 Tax=unclassified Herbiconiux TaxID=2618217 RepID=UPI00149169D7|nr:major capsid protein [Herbiconiux sp. SALV-R1]QJU54341.1 phage capsid protein [Herbiconiux sp. SALV-R1]WPO85411.1 major capsid protein [Herbiconiux sp. KACC 21604]